MNERYFKIKKEGSVVVERLLLADSFSRRLFGLMFRSPPQDKDGLLFEKCRSLHTHFMTYPLDIIFLDKNNKVVKVIKGMKPWRMTRPYFKADKAFEVKVGSLKCEIYPGDKLDVKCIS